MATTRNVFTAAAAYALLLLPGVCRGEITSCAEMQAAFALTATQDVEETISPAADILCETFTNMTMTSNSLTILSSEDLTRFFATTQLTRVRFEVTGGARLTWETNVLMDGVEDEDEQNNDGGAVFVGEGSSVRFLNDVEMRDHVIINQRLEDSDFANFVRDGGCLWNNGYFRVDGNTIFNGCDIVGAGESPPGDGGAVYNGETGSILFAGTLSITDTFITDDFGGLGAGIYNQGKVNIKGDAQFQELRANSGTAIYNDEGARFNFRNGATAFFSDVGNRDGVGSAVFNRGFLKFSGPALFVDADPPIIVAAEGSETILSKDSAFWDVADTGNDAISLSGDADISIPSSVSFVRLNAPDV